MPMPFSSSSRPSTRTRSSSVTPWSSAARSEEHTSELQSLAYLVCRLLLEKKKQIPRRGYSPAFRHTRPADAYPSPLRHYNALAPVPGRKRASVVRYHPETDADVG